LVGLSSENTASVGKVLAPSEDDAALLAKVKQLRSDGVSVVYALSGVEPAEKCTAQLVRCNGEWVVSDL
jgi:ATP phosphoribosyltransferase regulatory subunit